MLKNRIMVSANAWLYFLNLSRFGVDRRGHFRAVGETTTADLVTYKQKQREAQEQEIAQQVEDTKAAKEAAVRAKEVRLRSRSRLIPRACVCYTNLCG